MLTRTHSLCFREYAVLFSGVTRTALWSAEHLDAQQVRDAKQIKRNNAFHEEIRLPVADRSTLADYVRSGFDRGHLAPSGDFPSPESQHESFSLANMVPQNPNNNRGLWEELESATRMLARQRGEVYVVSGPLFEGDQLQRLNGRVLVPSRLYKAIYDPQRRMAAAYIVNNAPGTHYEVVSLQQLEQLSGIRIFPALPPEARTQAMDLPAPYGSRERAPRAPEADAPWYAGLLKWWRDARRIFN